MRPLCQSCGSTEIPIGFRRYCRICSRRASALWKREMRRRTYADWRSGATTVMPWLDGWSSTDAYRNYFREYMRRRRAAVGQPATTESGTEIDLHAVERVTREAIGASVVSGRPRSVTGRAPEVQRRNS